MRLTFTFGFLLGFAGLLAGTYFFPLVNHARIDSLTAVALNGGRTESFLIRLPVDRISSIGDSTAGMRAVSHPAGIALPVEFGATGLLVEHFKLRDAEGNVIGLTAHHATDSAAGTLSVWAFQIPGRGTVVFSGPARPSSAIDEALRNAGHVRGQRWNGEISVDTLIAADQTRIVEGTGEFRDVDGRLEQVWQITGVSATGELRGTIEFRTVVSGRQ